MNKVVVEYFNEETKKWVFLNNYVVMPYKYANLLDEQLDEAELQLTRVPSEIKILPQTKFKITVRNAPPAIYPSAESYNDLPEYLKTNGSIDTSLEIGTKRFSQREEKLMLVAEVNAKESPSGSGKYNYSIYLIEFTKFLESFICDSITFTNALGSNFVNNENVKDSVFYGFYNGVNTGKTKDVSYYKNIYTQGSNININTDIEDFFLYNFDNIVVRTSPGAGVFITDSNGNNVYSQWNEQGYLVEKIGSNELVRLGDIIDTSPKPFSLVADNGTYTIEYIYMYTDNKPSGAKAYFSVAQNVLPIKKWTITDVINRILELAEPLTDLERPRFVLQGVSYSVSYTEDGKIKPIRNTAYSGLAQKLDKILSPEFSLTKMTLREQLQVVGGFIHGEPRIVGETTDRFGTYFIISFDEYGNDKEVNLETYPTIAKSEQVGINDFCTSLDSSIDNLVNTLDYAQGVTVEPFIDGYKTVRAENVAIRLEENGETIIQSLLPIYEIIKLTARKRDSEQLFDITPYVYSLTDYNNLSSFEGSFPFVKSYALYYKQGEKNISGLFFKAPNAVDGIFSKYAISNILSQVTGEKLDLTINTLIEKFDFNLEYIPITSARIKTTKPVFNVGLPRTIAYNQTANSVETRFLGEHLKGVISRLGNVTKTYTYAFSRLSQIPKIGTKFNSDYFISTVSVEVLPTYLKVTLGLTKNFNRLSEYVGINSTKRMWEVSEKQVQERDTTICDYLMITKNIDKYQNNARFFNYDTIKPFKLFFNKFKTYNQDIDTCSAVVVYGETKNGTEINNQKFILPVVSSAFGNSLAFSFGFEDNYSVGQQINTNNGSFFTSYSNYTDYWGRLYYLRFYFSYLKYRAIDNADFDNYYEAIDLPLLTSNGADLYWDNGRFATARLNYQKDNREIPKITYQIQAITDSDLIIGSALMSNCRLVNRNPKNWVYVEFKDGIKLNAINSDLKTIMSDTNNYQMFENLDFITENNSVLFPGKQTNYNGAWAIVTKGNTITINVSDEDGNSITQNIVEGYELVLGSNTPRPETGLKIDFVMLSDIWF